jgi:Rps23 Pro-64 3,4-dihydroxylase Tpa1-like proline 4-hydroxylase
VRSLDAMGVIYRDTDRLLCHDDELEGRKIAYILNLSTGFTRKDGGALAILDSDKKGRPRDIVRRVTPTCNTFTFFTVSERSHHMVEEVLVKKDRLTIGGWFHG